MISRGKALKIILDSARALGPETVPLDKAVERVLAADIRARTALPPFSNSAMDGYAVRAEDLADAAPAAPVRLAVRAVSRAGGPAVQRLGPREATRIMTGAPLPPGADSVVMQELVESVGPGTVEFRRPCRPGGHVRRRGEDVRRGQLLLKKGLRLRPYEIALLAAQGFSEVPVVRRPVAAVIATGDELRPASRGRLPPGSIRNSNGPALAAALARWGIPIMDLGIVPDRLSAIKAAVALASRKADVIFLSGGVSVGDYDFTRDALRGSGFKELFWKVAIKPGKPLLLAARKRAGACPQLAFGLPGNPVAALLCLEEFARPALEAMQGLSLSHRSYHLRGRALNDYPKPQDRLQYLFCRAEARGACYELSILRPQGSALLGMPTAANALALAPRSASRVNRGDELEFRWLK